jgi:hypothetical protein
MISFTGGARCLPPAARANGLAFLRHRHGEAGCPHCCADVQAAEPGTGRQKRNHRCGAPADALGLHHPAPQSSPTVTSTPRSTVSTEPRSPTKARSVLRTWDRRVHTAARTGVPLRLPPVRSARHLRPLRGRNGQACQGGGSTRCPDLHLCDGTAVCMCACQRWTWATRSSAPSAR